MSDFDAEAIRWQPSEDPVLAVFEGLYRVSAGREWSARRAALKGAYLWRWGNRDRARNFARAATAADFYWTPFRDATIGLAPWVEILPANPGRVGFEIMNIGGSALHLGNHWGNVLLILEPGSFYRSDLLAPIPRGALFVRWAGEPGHCEVRESFVRRTEGGSEGEVRWAVL